MADPPIPNWDNFPNLDDIIKPEDIDTKGDKNSKYAADYVNHMKVSQLMRLHAPGWQFETRPFVDPDGIEHDCWKAPNGTAYIKGFFRAPTGSGFMNTPDMPQAVMGFKNESIAFDKVSARDFTDTERRCQCTAAARFFGLAYQLWAKVEIENPMRPAADNLEKLVAKPAKHAPTQSAPKPDLSAKAGELQDMRGLVNAALLGIFEKDRSVHPKWVEALKGKFPKIGATSPKVEVLNMEQLLFSKDFISNYKIETPAPKK